MAPILELRGLDKRFTGTHALKAVDLAFEKGEIHAIVGENGAGKSTLIKLLTGVHAPSGGTISVLGRPATRGNPRIGYMPQGSGAAPPVARLSGWDFVASVANGHRLGLPILSKAARAETERALDLVGAAKLARRPLADLSGGERQRLLLAQALVGEPQLLLLDEPLISLDPHHQQDVVELVKRLQDELKITILFSAHEINPLLSAIDQVLYLGGGKAALGAVDEVITGPVLSRLYGAEIDVIRVKGRIFVMSGGYEVERDEHRHEAAHGHGAAHGRGAHGHV